ncbi:E3 binding domain-containing protein [Halalkalicoccus sp. NIPERK01]|uniref:E3 binding domain-containing protein n=1 Tax=Halalkalicoccus sp. NIPERK01 TaxID=3053469 RepID=UPI00256F1ED6|nr:E3 binding domain-containing protein [Halalkalicoccus sp. NIPERK01]
MPKLGLEMEQGTLLEWYLEEGDSLEEGEVLAEIESEKSIGEIEAREDGVLRLVDLAEGESVPPGTPIGIVAGADEDIADLETEFDGGDEAAAAEPAEGEREEAVEASSDTETAATTQESGADASAEQVKASPRAKRRAEELGVSLPTIDGTGPQGAITEDDVEAAASGDETTGDRPAAEGVKASPRAKRRAEELDVDLTAVDGTGPQGAITEEDVESAAEAETAEAPTEAIESTVAEADRADVRAGRYRTATLVVSGADADAVIEATDLSGRAFDVETSPLDALLVAASAALTDCPAFNATFEDGTHHLHGHQDVALATESDGDLVRPVLEAVETRPFAELVEMRRETTEEAVASGVSGGRATFALALDGEVGGDLAAVVTPPTVAGLVANVSRRRAVPAENGVSLERCLSLSLAYDTRILGDADAEEFLGALRERIGDLPELVLRTYREQTP